MRSTALAVILFGAAVAGCGGGGSDGGAVVGAPAGAPQPPGGAPIDAQLRAALANDGIVTPALRPTESAELIALGRALFFDKELSGNRNIACATCHHPT